MKSLRELGTAIPRPCCLFPPRITLRRLVPLAALIAGGAILTLSPAFALRMSARVGFQLPEDKPLAVDAKGDSVSFLGQIRANSNVPLTVALSGGETGDAQLLVTAKGGLQTTTYTRAVHLTGAPQTIQMTLLRQATTPNNFGGPGALTLQLLQDGRSLAQQETVLATNIRPNNFNVLSLTGRREALQFLHNTNNLYVTHLHRDNQQNSVEPSANTPRLLASTPESLPDMAQAYDAVDAVVLAADYGPTALTTDVITTDQEEALREYVRQGGRLILVEPADKGPIWYENFRNSLGKTGWQSTVNETGFDSSAKVYGTGTVFLVPNKALSNQQKHLWTYSQQQERLWIYVLGGRTLPLFSPKQALVNSSLQSNNSEMTDALAGRQAAQTVPFPLITGFLLAYIVLIVPVNYLVLKKIDRRELAWITAPALVFLFSGVSYAVAHAIKGGKLTVNRAVLYETFANTDEATGYGQFTLYSPRRASYTLSLGDANDAANPYHDTLPTEMPRVGASDLTLARDASVTLRNVSVPIWDTRTFNLPVAANLGGKLEARVTQTDPATLSFTLTNHTKYDLHHCYVVVGNQTVSMSDLAAGETAQAVVPWSKTVINTAYSINVPDVSPFYNNQTSFSLRQKDELPGETRGRIREAMHSILRTSYYFNGRVNQNTTVCGFIGWFDAKTLDVRVDGNSAAGEQENMLYAHLPLPRGAKTTDGTENAALRLIPDAADVANDTTTTQEKTDAE